MTLKLIDFEAGTSGVDLTTGNSGATLVLPGSGNSIKFTNDTPAVGSLCARITATTTGSNAQARWAANANDTKMAYEFYFRTDSSSAQQSIFKARDTTGVAFQVLMSAGSNGPSLTASNGALLSGTYSGGGTHGMDTNFFIGETTVGTWYRMAILADVTAGTIQGAIYEGSSTTPLETPLSYTGGGFGTNPLVGMDAVIYAAGTVSYDAIQFNDGATTEIGPPTTGPTETATIQAFDGTTWRDVKAWDGTAWVPVKAWDGTSWVPAD